jgi:hypothetical protein
VTIKAELGPHRYGLFSWTGDCLSFYRIGLPLL